MNLQLCRYSELLAKLNKDQAEMNQLQTRHRESTSMYSLTFRVRVTTPPQYGQNGMVHAAGTSILLLVCAEGLADHCWALPRIFSVVIVMQPVHRLQIRPIVHN